MYDPREQHIPEENGSDENFAEGSNYDANGSYSYPGRGSNDNNQGYGSGSTDESAQSDPIPVEYSYVTPRKHENSISDAGYVSKSEAPVIPNYYYSSSGSSSQSSGSRRQKTKSGMSGARFIAMCLVCALVGGIGGASVNLAGLLTDSATDDPALTDSASVDDPAQSETIAATSTPVSLAGTEMDPSEIYDMACLQTVGISTEVTYQNFFNQTSSAAVTGSGFIISSDGYIMTNYHVIETAADSGYDVQVMLYSGEVYTAEIIGYDSDNDIAVLKIEAEGLNAVTIGDSSTLKVGETLRAVGNPLGELAYSMTTGTVSALDRAISVDSTSGSSKTISMFQFDAAVNSGNSGGPVFNSSGEVVGVVTAKYSSSGVEGLGFAIPINDAMDIAEQLISQGYVSGKPYVGILDGVDVTSFMAAYYKIVEGFMVYEVEAGSAGEAAGLTRGDVITKLDSKDILSYSELSSALGQYSAGDTVTITVYREDQYVELTLTLDEAVPK